MIERPAPTDVAVSFDRSAQVYDDHVSHNRSGAERLVAAVPEGRYPRVLDVACGTGFAALAAIPRLGVEEVVGVDASGPMVEVFRERLAAFPAVRSDLRVGDVMGLRVPDGSADLVLCTMALHWFAERRAAIALMARALAPGGVLAVLAPGPGHDRMTVERIRASGDPLLGRLADVIVANEVDPDLLAEYVSSAGLTPLDVWTERRTRRVEPAAYAARLEAVASHIWSDLTPEGQAEALVRTRTLLEAHAEADGLYRYRFVKTFAVARLG